MNRTRGWVVVLLFAVALVSGCASANVKSARPFADGKTLESLERGTSTRSDVQRLLGVPDGSGQVLLPNEDTELDLWYYADLEMTDVRQVAGGFRGDVRQQVLLVAFRGDVFEGFMWWSSAGSLK